MRNLPRSIFVGKTVPLVAGTQPLLYPRCYTREDALDDSTSTQEQRLTALGLPTGFALDKKRKIQDFLVTPTTTKHHSGKAKELPGGGNAEEALHMRHLMGLDKKKDTLESQNFTFEFTPQSDLVETPQATSWNVFVGGMPYSWSPDDIRDFWGECGEVLDVECMMFHDTGRFKGLAKIAYRTEEGYKAALQCNGDSWDGFSFVVTPWKAKGTSTASLSNTTPSKPRMSSQDTIGQKVEGFDVLFMCNLPLAMTQDDVASLFDAFDIEAVKLKADPTTGRSKGYAHIHFGRADDRLEKAIAKLDHTEIQGRVVRLGYAEPPPNWKPKTKASRKRSLREMESEFTSESFQMLDGRYLVRFSGFLPTATEEEIRKFFSGTSLADVLLLWSVRNQRNSGAVYLVVPDEENLRQLLAKDRTFYQSRRLHVRPGKFRDYLQKASRKRKVVKVPSSSGKNGRCDEIDDPLMSLL